MGRVYGREVCRADEPRAGHRHGPIIITGDERVPTGGIVSGTSNDRELALGDRQRWDQSLGVGDELSASGSGRRSNQKNLVNEVRQFGTVVGSRQHHDAVQAGIVMLGKVRSRDEPPHAVSHDR